MESVPPDARVRTFLADCPDFGRFWFARVASALAVQMQAVAVGWQVYALTGSAFALGMVGLAQFLPMALLTLPAGHAADRYDRRTICVIALTVQFAAGGVLAVGCWGHWIGVPGIFGAVALIAAARAFERPANQSLLPALVPRPLVPKAVAWATGGFQSASVVGPALGGVLYGFGPAVPYATAAVLALAALALMATLRVTPGAVPREPATFRSIFAGLDFIRRQPVILGSISLDLFAVLLGGATALLPAFAHDILGVGAWGLGALRAAPAVGSVLMSAYLARRPLERQVGRKMFGAVLVFGMATILFGFSRSFVLSLAALTMLGAADIISVVVRSSLVQLATPDAMRGRVNAVNGLFIGTSNQLGEFESGVTAALFGTVAATVLGGLGTVVVAFLWMRLFPDLGRFDRIDSHLPANQDPPPTAEDG
jgi:MFS family permease